MRLPDDAELLTEYTTRHSEDAFAELVRRHVALVYSAALRQVREPQLAEDVTQAVFIILARKARAVRRHTALSGWLCRVAHFVSRDALRAERRRRHREQAATRMENTADTDWMQIAPLLDEVVARLNEKDRNAIVLRFYEQKSFGEVGNVLGVDADAAQKRVSRALEKLHRYFAKRGVSSTTAIIADAISAHSVQAAPVALAKSVTAVAIAKGAAASGSTLTLIKGALKIMAWTKMKTAIVVGVGVLLAAGTTTVVVKKINHSPSNDIHAITNLQQVMITMVVLKAPTAEVDAVIHDFGEPQIPLNPKSQMFQDMLKRHPDVEYLESPRIITMDGTEASASISKPVQVDGTNTDIGISLYVTPTVQPDSRIALKIRSELRELVDGASPSVRVTKEDEQTKPVKSGEATLVVRKKISDDGQTVGGNPNDEAKTLLVFVNATLVKQRLQSIIKRTQP